MLTAAGCAHPQPAAPAPDYRPVATEAGSPHAQLYADCLADAIANKRFAHAHDPSTDLILFTCTAEPAHAFFDGLAGWSAQIGSEVTTVGKTLRTTQKVRRDLFGVDYCAREADSFSCVITLNAGEFLR